MKKLSYLSFFSIILIFISFTSCVKNEVTKVSISDNEKSLTLGQIDSLFVDTEYTGDIIPSVIWTSSNSAVVKVSQGEIEGKAKGTAVITAQAGSKTATCNVTVNNEIKPALTKGELWFFGDIYETGFSNNFTVCIASSGINIEDLTGDGEYMYLEFNTDLTVNNSIPSGTYEVNFKYEAGTMVPGYVDDDGFPWGTWYFGKTENDVVSGIVVVSSINNIYTIVYNFVDYYGNNISGTFTGPLTYFDYEKKSAPQFVSNKMKIRNIHNLFNTKVLNRIK